MSNPMTHAEERRGFAEFSAEYAEPEYRTQLAALQESWRGFNEQHYAGRLQVPHMMIGRTAPRSLGHCKRTSDHGGQIQINFNPGLIFGTTQKWLRRPWQEAAGARRFVEDLLLRFTVQQYVMELLQDDREQERQGGCGPKFVAEANRIGGQLGLGEVAARGRGRDRPRPVAVGWPHCVRPAGYYGDGVTEAALGKAGCNLTRCPLMGTASAGTLELLVYLKGAGRGDEADELMRRHLEWGKAAREEGWAQRKKVEAGEEDVDGRPLGDVEFRREWLAWNGGTVRRMAEGISEFRNFGDLPLLAEALELAGCADGRVLRHLRGRVGHGRGCWVLRGLVNTDADSQRRGG